MVLLPRRLYLALFEEMNIILADYHNNVKPQPASQCWKYHKLNSLHFILPMATRLSPDLFKKIFVRGYNKNILLRNYVL